MAKQLVHSSVQKGTKCTWLDGDEPTPCPENAAFVMQLDALGGEMPSCKRHTDMMPEEVIMDLKVVEL